MSESRPTRLPTGAAVTAGILLLIPIAALMWVPLYAKEDPELWGFPFFYWYQFVWVFLASLFTWAAFTVINKARAHNGDRR